MILMADSGSTKTDWRLIDDNKQIHQYATQGITPYFQSSLEIADIIKKELLSQSPILGAKSPMEIYFYGAGCGNDEKKNSVRTAMKSVFSSSVIEVNSDMLAAARCLCGRNAGLVAILGTGSNTCYYDGTEIESSVASLGYVLGDEGSGAHIGKTFIQAYLNHELPEHLEKRFYERFKLTKDDILDAVYRKPMPNRFLASFCKFVFQNLKEQYVIDMVVKCFAQFFEKHICKYPQHKVMQLNCSGSIAFYFSDVLRKVASEYSVNIGTIVESPIAGLTLFHLEE